MSTEENEEVVGRVYTRALEARAEGRPLDEPEQVVYEIEMLSQEVNSGASFEQYCRWASSEEIGKVVGRLEALGLSAVADITRRALAVAFPDGLPASDDEKDDQTDWTEEQEERLSALAEEFTEYNGRVMNVLGGWYRGQHGGSALS